MSDEPRVLAGRYRLVSVLGRGGMGQVWLAEDEVLHRQVAVKEIRFPDDLPADEREVLRQRTMREARLTARLTHPGIVTVHDVVSQEGRPYIVMELIAAPSLAATIDKEGPLPPPRVAEIGLRLLEALHIAHAQGVVHRDVKPSNVLLAGDRVVLSDFGIAISSSDATLTTTGLVVGSPTYMSPERLRSEGIGPGGDMWSLGATLYAALEGHPPFRSENVMGTITAVLSDSPAPPAVDGPLREAVLGLLDKSPDRRLGSEKARQLLLRASEQPQRPGESSGEQHPTTDLPVMAPAASTPDPVVSWHEHPAQPIWEPVSDWQSEPVDPTSTSPDHQSSRTPRPPGRLTPFVALLVVLAVAVVTVVVVLGWPGGAEESGTEESGTEQSGTGGGVGANGRGEPAVGGDGPTRAELPNGFRLVQDPLDFTVAVPKGWQRRLDGATRVDYVSPDGTRFLRIDQRAEAGADAEQAWLDAEPSVADSLSGYSRLRIEPVDFRGWGAADWEFTWEGDSGTVHVLNRGFITDPRGFALYMSGPDDTWEASSLPVFEVAAETFEPAA